MQTSHRFFQFTVPSSPIIPTELEAWKAAASNKINPNTLSTVLERLVTDVSFSKLTPMSQTYILSKSNEDKLALIEKIGGKILNSGTITCIAKLTKSAADIMDILVFGTEHCDVFLIDGQAFTIIQQIKLQSVPVTIRTYGMSGSLGDYDNYPFLRVFRCGLSNFRSYARLVDIQYKAK